MKIVLNSKEAAKINAMINIMSDGEKVNGLEEINAYPLCKYGVSTSGSKDVAVSIDSAFVEELLDQCNKGYKIIIPLIKGFFAACSEISNAIANITVKHLKAAKEKAEKKAALQKEYMKHTDKDIDLHQIVKMLKANNVTKVSELPATVVFAIHKTYSTESIKKAEQLLIDISDNESFTC